MAALQGFLVNRYFPGSRRIAGSVTAVQAVALVLS